MEFSKIHVFMNDINESITYTEIIRFPCGKIMNKWSGKIVLLSLQMEKEDIVKIQRHAHYNI